MRRLVPIVLLLMLMLWVPSAQAWTWPVSGPVLQGFTFDPAHPYAGGQHRGVDVGASADGVPVLAPTAGVVSFAGTVPSSGKSVTIDTSDGLSVTLTHLGSIGVAKNASVAEGAVIGTVGPSGTPEVAAPYVHLGVRTTVDAQGYLDPLGFLPVLGAASPAPPPAPTEPPAAATPPAPVPAPAEAPATATPPAPTEPVEVPPAPAPSEPAVVSPAPAPAEPPAVATLSAPAEPPAVATPSAPAEAPVEAAPPLAPAAPAATPAEAVAPVVAAPEEALPTPVAVAPAPVPPPITQPSVVSAAPEPVVPAAPEGAALAPDIVAVTDDDPFTRVVPAAFAAPLAATAPPGSMGTLMQLAVAHVHARNGVRLRVRPSIARAPFRTPAAPAARALHRALPRAAAPAVAPARALGRALPVAFALLALALCAGVSAGGAALVRIIRGPSPSSEGARPDAIAAEDPRRAGLAVREWAPSHRPRGGLRRAGGRVRALPPLEGQRRADGLRDGRARHAGDGVRRPERRIAA